MMLATSGIAAPWAVGGKVWSSAEEPGLKIQQHVLMLVMKGEEEGEMPRGNRQRRNNPG